MSTRKKPAAARRAKKKEDSEESEEEVKPTKRGMAKPAAAVKKAKNTPPAMVAKISWPASFEVTSGLSVFARA